MNGFKLKRLPSLFLSITSVMLATAPLAAEHPAKHSMDDLIGMCVNLATLSPHATPSTQTDFVRHFIGVNSAPINSSPSGSNETLDEKLGRILDHFFHGGPPPYVSGPSRFELVSKILGGLEIHSRAVYLFTSQYDDLRGHMVLEVFDPSSGRWEAHDPVYDIHFEAIDAARLDAKELVALSQEEMQPCAFNGCHDWPEDPFLNEPHLHNFCEAALYVENGKAKLYINTEKFDLTKGFTNYGGQSFLQILEQWYSQPVVVRL